MKKVSDAQTTIELLNQLVAIELWRAGLSQGEIAKRLGTAKANVNSLLKGVSRMIAVGTAIDDRK